MLYFGIMLSNLLPWQPIFERSHVLPFTPSLKGFDDSGLERKNHKPSLQKCAFLLIFK